MTSIIWLHDAVYNTGRNDNEEQSAELASQILDSLHVNMQTIKFVKDLILATKGHNGSNLSEDAKLFLDMDLAILGMQSIDSPISVKIFLEQGKTIAQNQTNPDR